MIININPHLRLTRILLQDLRLTQILLQDGFVHEKLGCGGRKPGFSQRIRLIAAAFEVTRPESPTSAADIDSTRDRIRVFPFGTFLRHLKLFCMTIQQDPYGPDRWWFAPLLYAGTAVLIAALVLA